MKIIHSKSRLEGFSDAVFAFAATLLVVSLDIPDTFQELTSQLKGFVAFGISFFALVLIWKVHYNYFRRITKIDNWIIGLNMLMVFVLLFYIYPLKFLITLPFIGDGIQLNEFSQLFQLYGLGFCLVFGSVALLYVRSMKIEDGEEKKLEFLFHARHFGTFVITAIVSIILAYANVGLVYGLPGFAYGLIGPLAALNGKWLKKKKSSIK